MTARRSLVIDALPMGLLGVFLLAAIVVAGFVFTTPLRDSIEAKPQPFVSSVYHCIGKKPSAVDKESNYWIENGRLREGFVFGSTDSLVVSPARYIESSGTLILSYKTGELCTVHVPDKVAETIQPYSPSKQVDTNNN
jgi:hypothetical protein